MLQQFLLKCSNRLKTGHNLIETDFIDIFEWIQNENEKMRSKNKSQLLKPVFIINIISKLNIRTLNRSSNVHEAIYIIQGSKLKKFIYEKICL